MTTVKCHSQNILEDYPACSVQFTCSVVSDSLWPHEPQHARPPYHQLPESTQTHVHQVSDAFQPSYPLSSSSSLPSIYPSIRVFSISRFFTSGGQSSGVSASTSVLPMNTQDWCPLELTGLISLQCKQLSRVFSNTAVQASVLQCSAFFIVQLSHPYKTTGKTIAWIDGPFLVV